jgi:hypothetical protein
MSAKAKILGGCYAARGGGGVLHSLTSIRMVEIGRKISWEKRNSTVDAGIDTLGV